MSQGPDPQEVAALVLAHIQGAAEAVRDQDIRAAICCLDAAVALYEQHPRFVHEPSSQLRDLLVYIRSTRSLCQTLRLADDALNDLDERAETLRRSALH
jgi:hypothetical protein